MATATLNDITWRLWVGPHYTHFDWSTIDAGSALYTAQPSNTVGTTQTSGTTSLVLTSGTTIPTSGGVWVGPNATGEGWEYEQYTGKSTNTLTGVTRESSSDRDHTGIHTAGATVHYYYPITSNDGTLNITEDADENVSTVAWQATVSGVLAPHFVMRESHVVVVETSTNGGAYSVFLVGFLSAPHITGNAQSSAEWSFTIMSSAHILSQLQADGVRAGDNLMDGEGTASTPLVLAYDERWTGDYTKAAPDFTATSITDNLDDTLWLTERFKGADIWDPVWNNDPENSYSGGSGVRFSQVYVNPPASAGPFTKWIEIVIGAGTTNHTGYAIYHANGGGSVEWQYGGPGTVASGDRIILCEDEDVFTRMNPLASVAVIYESTTFFDDIDPTGSELWIRLGELNQWNCRMRWGHGDSYVQHEDAPSRTWTGATITAPATGETMRYRFDITTGDAADYWETGMTRHVGYDLDVTLSEWAMVTFPGFGLKLTNDITDSSPGASDPLYISGPDDNPSVDGLPDSGTVVLGDEQITYSAKAADSGYVTVTARGANSTTAAIHNADDEIFILDGSVTTDAFLSKEVGWSRYSGTIYPKVFKVYTTNFVDNVRTPAESDYDQDWTLRGDVSAHAASTYTLPLSTVRVRHILIEVYEMTSNPARVRLNEFYAYMDPANHQDGLWLDADTTADAMITAIVENVGLPTGCVVVDETLPALDNIQTQSGGDAWTVIADLAEFTGSEVLVARDSKLHLAVNDFWDGSIFSTLTWSRANAESIQVTSQPSQYVSQVVLPWRSADGETTGTVTFPTTPSDGAKLEVNETIYANESAALAGATRLYYMRRYPVEFTVNASIDGSAYRPLDAHIAFWQYNLDHVLVSRYCIVLSTNHTLTKGHWASELRLLQYDHKSNFT